MGPETQYAPLVTKRDEAMSQEIKNIALTDLVLWTENPRDPIDPKATDQQVVRRAVVDAGSKWNLKKLAKEMGSYYDLSELPTVVYHGKTPIVYDGNRRIVLGKIKHKLAEVEDFDIDIPEFPTQIPCNVCSKDIALQNVFRKHADTGSWLPLERDIFVDKHMKHGKSLFLLLDESTGIISSNEHMNQRFVKEEIFRDDILEKLGLAFDGNMLLSKHSAAETLSILEDLSQKIKSKTISTRSNRGKVLEVLDPSNQKIIDQNRKKKAREVHLDSVSTGEEDSTKTTESQRRSRRTNSNKNQIFGGHLYLQIGPVSNLYRDICDLYKFYTENKNHLSDAFPSLIRMALRLLCETAAKECKQDLGNYTNSRFAAAKATMDQNEKTTLSNQNVTASSIVQLLQTGAHNYTASSDVNQTLAVSLIVGRILNISHGKEEASK